MTAGWRRPAAAAAILAYWCVVLGALVFALALTAARLWLLPALEGQREQVAAYASATLGAPVTIGRLSTGWQGINPRIELIDLRISAADGRTALALPRVEALLSWLSLAVFELRLARLEIEGPDLLVERAADGTVSVAGIALGGAGGGRNPFADWLGRQRRIVIADGSLTWIDRQRDAPPLRLDHIGFRLDNLGPWHRFALRGAPPAELASVVDLRGSIFGFAAGGPEAWRGELFLDVDGIDLAAWQRWVNLPFELSAGGAGLRAWIDIADGRPVGGTADISLARTRSRLAARLPELAIESAAGRVSVSRREGGYRLRLDRLQLETADGLRVAPVDAELAWQLAGDGQVSGQLELSSADLATLARLADFLPVDSRTRTLLADHRPQGRLAGVRASWRGSAEALSAYSLRADFEQLGVAAQGRIPGVAGLTGGIEASERGGRVFLRAGPSAIELPAVFPVPRLAFDALAGSLRWTWFDGALELDLQALNFSAIDAVGTAHGRYRSHGEGPGELDLTANLTRAETTAVWRYLPHLVPAATRDWLRAALKGGVVERADLRLQGELAAFPFDAGGGSFLVTARVRDGVLAYQPDWPAIEGLDADLRFSGSRMEIVSRSARIAGVPLQRTRVVLPDLAADDPVLRIDGAAAGPLSGFLGFLERSPLAERLGGFWHDWQAAGHASLELGLSIPLDRADDTRVEGRAELRELRLSPVGFLPPVTRLSGQLAFTESGVEASGLRGEFLGRPLGVTVRSQGGHAEVAARGSAPVESARRHFGWHWLAHLGGEAGWQAQVTVDPEQRLSVTVDADLQDVSSALPAPFGKPVGEPLPFAVRYHRGEGPDRLTAALGETLRAELAGRLRDDRWQIGQGAVAVGTPPAPPPASGWSVSADLPFFDADHWQRLLADEPASGGEPWPLEAWPRLALRFGVLRAAGREWPAVALGARVEHARLQGQIESPRLAGSWSWRPAAAGGTGQLGARLARLHVPALPRSVAGDGTGSGAARAVLSPAPAADEGRRIGGPALPAAGTAAPVRPPAARGAPERPPAEALLTATRLPDLDIVADDARFGELRFGRLDLAARTAGEDWLIERFAAIAADGDITARGGHYRDAGGHRSGPGETRLSVAVSARDLGAMLDRLGHPGTISRGEAQLGGALAWPGGLAEFAAGRLSGDVISEGLAFDEIDGRFMIAGGVMHTEGFRIDGPSARVLMAGDIDLGRETQDLRLAIRPALGSTVALGAAILANPIAGVATLLAQKLLRDPLDKAFAVEYAVSGAWAEPKVERVGLVAGGLPPAGANP